MINSEPKGVFHLLIGGFRRFGDVALAVLVIMIITLMIMPIPIWMLDTLLAVNLTMSVVLLMMSMYVPGVIQFSTFPSVLLFTTLFRLSLNVTTTRLILIHGYAGAIINTFGNFLVAGNFVVGAVIFLIILIVQFIVVTKGAERVAEVAARFTLDAMPGKQMSIDADLRAGNLQADEAKAKRALLEKESQLYGAMDGAMKFVKGDAIAALIIVAINILAGLAIGILQRGMTVDDAVATYSILTIGDGLVSQIPALLISITAGIIVTRVQSEEGQPLGIEVFSQLFGQYRVYLISGVMLFGFAFIPGFPKPIFFILGSIILGTGWALSQKLRFQKKLSDDEEKGDIPALHSASGKKGEKGKGDGKDEFSITVPLMVEVASSLKACLPPAKLNKELADVRSALYHDLGVPFPGIHLQFSASAKEESYTILLQEVPLTEGFIRPDFLFIREEADNLKLMGIPYEEGEAFIPGANAIWVRRKFVKKLKDANITVMEPSEVLTFHLSFILKRYAADFIGIQETKYLLDQLGKDFPDLIREIERVLPFQKLTDIFQRLVQEEISIRNLRLLVQSLIDWGQREKETVLLTEYCRSSLKRWISYKFSGGQNTLPVYLLEPDLEDTVRKAIRQTSSGSYLALEPAVSDRIVLKIKEVVGTDSNPWAMSPVLLTSMDIRRYMRKLIEVELYYLPVLSYQELTEEITLQPIGRVGLS